MSDSTPRHLAPRSRGNVVRRRRWLYATGVVVVLAAGITAVAVIGHHGRSAVSPEFTVVSPPSASNPGPRGAATTGTPSTTTPPSTTAPPGTSTPPASGPPQPIQRTPGNLLVNGDFESDLAGWLAVGRGVLNRVAIGHSGGWSVRISDGGKSAGTGDPGMRSTRAVTGGTYEASAWLRASRPGTQAILALREPGGSGAGSGDLIGVTLTDAGWHQIAVVHEVGAGTSMTIEVTATNLRPADDLLVDQVSIIRS